MQQQQSQRRYSRLRGALIGAAAMLAPVTAAHAQDVDPCMIALAPHAGDSEIDTQIAALQTRAGDPSETDSLIRLGWSYVAKARASHDPGYYGLAEQAALCLGKRAPDHADGLLLQGHARHRMHDFKQAEALARRLVERRATATDYALLGDALLDQGVLDQASAAYQSALGRGRSAPVLARLAHLRWLQGDLDGARTEVRRAILLTRDPATSVWLRVRLAQLEFQAGNRTDAARLIDRALELKPDHAPALLLRGRMLLAADDPAAALGALRQAARLDPTPEYFWALIDALRAAGEDQEAKRFETTMLRTGVIEDPRTVALYLATVGRPSGLAVRLARAELKLRKDVHTLDALAWALAADGRVAEAREAMKRALLAGTADPRLHLHAGIIAASSDRSQEARRWLNEAKAAQQMLLPSEQALLTEIFTTLDQTPTD